MRVLVTGASGELGYRVTTILEADASIDVIAAVDLRPPSRRFRRAQLTVVDPRERRRLVATVQRFAPTAIVHLGVYEPDARSSPALAPNGPRRPRSPSSAPPPTSGGLDRIVVRSGLEVYGRGRGMVSVPDEDVAPDPGTPFGRSLVDVERVAVATGHSADVPVATLRLAPVPGDAGGPAGPGGERGQRPLDSLRRRGRLPADRSQSALPVRPGGKRPCRCPVPPRRGLPPSWPFS